MAAMTAAMVTAFWPGVKPLANCWAWVRARSTMLVGTRAISERHVHDLGERVDRLVGHRRGDLRGQRGLRRSDQGVGDVALAGGGLSRLGGGSGLDLLDLVDGVADDVAERAGTRRARRGP